MIPEHGAEKWTQYKGGSNGKYHALNSLIFIFG